jgi:hypothetical protein
MRTPIPLLIFIFLSFPLAFFFHPADAQGLKDQSPQSTNAIEKYIAEKIFLPADAYVFGVVGRVGVKFTVAANGLIVPKSVSIVSGLYPSCDTVVLEAIRNCKLKWNPALLKGKPVGAEVTQFIEFKNINPALAKYKLSYPIHTVVLAKPAASVERNWAVYADRAMEYPVKGLRLSPDDSLAVSGWAPWSFQVTYRDQMGYVSRSAVKIHAGLDSLAKVIEEKSPDVEAAEKRLVDSVVARAAPPSARLMVTPAKASIYAGECVILNIDFDVHKDNRVPLQFYNVAEQLYGKILPTLYADKERVTRSTIVNIAGIVKQTPEGEYTSYRISNQGFCPSRTGTIQLPAVTLSLAKVNRTSKEVEQMIDFTSQPFTISVNPLPAGTKSGSHNLVGSVKIVDSFATKNIFVGEPVIYTISISGAADLYSLLPPILSIENATSALVNIDEKDTVVNNEYSATRSLQYKVIFSKAGAYTLKDKVVLTFFDRSTKAIKSAGTSSAVNVLPGNSAISHDTSGNRRRHYIAIDVSESMGIEDYSPDRLNAATNAVQEFFHKRGRCDIGIIFFAAKAVILKTTNGCYGTDDFHLKQSEKKELGTGTNLGRPLWEAIGSFGNDSLQKKIVIIGDGDNTAGQFSANAFGAAAKDNNIRIYAIGVGNTGPVPYGEDVTGKPYFINNTFRDTDFKAVTATTGGAYYWAKDQREIEKFLEMIFQE